MPLRRELTRVFHRCLYNAILERLTLLKRNDDQQEGVVTAYILFQCRRSMMYRSGEPIQGDETSSHRCTWHIPRVELKRVGVDHLNAVDRLVDVYNRWWEPESTTMITHKLFDNHVCLDCLRVDPNPNIVLPAL